MRTAGAIVNRMAEKRTNLLVISDAIAGNTGLGRIARELVTRAHGNLKDMCRVGSAGYGSPGSCKFGDLPQYNLEGMNEWVLPTLPDIIEDFAGSDPVTIMYIWDLNRLAWLVEPRVCEAPLLAEKPHLRQWAIKRPFKLWCYAPIDASGPNDKFTFPLMRAAFGVDRLIAYGPFGESVLRRSIGDEAADKKGLTNLPHGIDGSIFYERSRALCRHMFRQITGGHFINEDREPIADDETLVGIVATNQSRKDWPLGLEAAALLGRERKIRLWIHTDGWEKNWSIPSLLTDYGLVEKVIVSNGLIPDENMAQAYSACDLTFGIGPEGWGFPLAESLACGTPVVTGSYAGAADFVPKEMQVDPIGFRYEGSYACKRPVYSPEHWALKAHEFAGIRTSLDPQYYWTNLWPRWEAWFREGFK